MQRLKLSEENIVLLSLSVESMKSCIANLFFNINVKEETHDIRIEMERNLNLLASVFGKV
jgi:hypothetical protein